MFFAARPLAAAGPGMQGQVFALDEQGKLTGVVAGAKIELKTQAGQVAASATSNTNGFYKADLPPGTYFYKVQAQGYKDENVGRGIQLKLSEGYTIFNFSLTKGKNDPNTKPPIIPLLQIGKLQGKVLEKTGDGKLIGIPGALVALRGSKAAGLSSAITSGQSAGQVLGHYEITLAVDSWQASASAKGFQTAVDPIPIKIVQGQTATRDFILTRNVPIAPANQGIRGTVRINNPKLPPGTLPPVKISILPLASSGTTASAPGADGQGRYSQDLRPGGYQVIAEATGYITARSGPKAVFPTKYTIVDLTLVPAATPVTPINRELGFDGTVFGRTGDDVVSRRPLAGAAVLLHKQGDATARAMQGTTDAQGRMHLVGVSAGVYQATAQMQGYNPQTINVTISDKGPNRGEFVLSKPVAPVIRELSFDGTVFALTGDDVVSRRPLAGATVLLHKQGDATARAMQGMTDAQGRMHLVGVSAGVYQATAQMQGYNPQTINVTISDKGPNRGEFVLSKPVTQVTRELSFDGMVFGQTSEDRVARRPLAGAAVLLRKQGDTTARAVQGITNAQGKVHLKVIGAGNYEAMARMEGFSPQTINVTIRDGGENHAEFVLKKINTLPAKAMLHVQVSDTNRKPIPGAIIAILRNGQQLSGGQTDSGGNFNSSLPESIYDVVVSKQGYRANQGKANLTQGNATVGIILTNESLIRPNQPKTPIVEPSKLPPRVYQNLPNTSQNNDLIHLNQPKTPIVEPSKSPPKVYQNLPNTSQKID
jgi:hypothetical protein